MKPAPTTASRLPGARASTQRERVVERAEHPHVVVALERREHARPASGGYQQGVEAKRPAARELELSTRRIEPDCAGLEQQVDPPLLVPGGRPQGQPALGQRRP